MSGRTRRGARRATRVKSPDLAALEEELRSSLGTKVELIKARRGGRVTIHFYSDEELEALTRRLLG